jgi:hypothetical protein
VNPTRVELIHELVSTAVAEGLRNAEIRNRINMITQQEERGEAIDYLKLLRTRRGEDINLLTGESNLGDDFSSPKTISVVPGALEAGRGRLPFAEWPIERRGLTRELIWTAFDTVENANDKRPARTLVAGRLHISESTLRRAQEDLGIPGWPPARQPVSGKIEHR